MLSRGKTGPVAPVSNGLLATSTFDKLLSDLARQHEVEISSAIIEHKAEINRLKRRLNEDVQDFKKFTKSKTQQSMGTQQSVQSCLTVPGTIAEDTPIESKTEVTEINDFNNAADDSEDLGPVMTVETLIELPKNLKDDTDDDRPPSNGMGGRISTSSAARGNSHEAYQDAPTRRRSLFPDAEEMKMQVREAISGRPQYSVADYYWETGSCQAIARNPIFENVSFAVIFAVVLWIWIDTDYNDADTLLDAHPIFVLGANSFCIFFTFEVLVRFGAFKRKVDCFKDPAFLFDAVLVLQDVLETWCLTFYVAIKRAADGSGDSSSPMKFGIFRILRMAKIIRMGRAMRLMRQLPEIAILVKGIGIATRSVFFTLVLLFIIIYVFAVVFRQITRDTEMGDLYFENVPTSINSLLLDGVLPDNAQIVNDLAGQDWYLWPLIMFFILLASLTVMNMLVGVLVEVVGVVADAEKEGLAVSSMRDSLVKVMHELDLDSNGYISKAEVDKLLIQPAAAKILENVGIDVVGLVDLSDVIFEDYGCEGELDLEDFMNVVLDLRTQNTAKVKDIVMLQKLMKRDMTRFFDRALTHISMLIATGAAWNEDEDTAKLMDGKLPKSFHLTVASTPLSKY
jgi:hypothetical protein